MPGERLRRSRLKVSEVMTRVIAFHASGFRTCKGHSYLSLGVTPQKVSVMMSFNSL